MAISRMAGAQGVPGYSPILLESFLPQGQDYDLSFLSSGANAGAGLYSADLYLNGQPKQVMHLEMRETENGLAPVFKVRDLLTLPLRESVLVRLSALAPDREAFPLADYLSDSTAVFDPLRSTLHLSIPQIHLAEAARYGDVAPKALWNYGINGLILNYNLTGNILKSRTSDLTTKSGYGNFNTRLNAFGWRFYSSAVVNYTKQSGSDAYLQGSETETDIWNTYLMRDLPQIDGTVSVGEVMTSGDIFDSFSIRGIRVKSNEMMLPRRQREYSPVIQGVANSDAQILIRQNGHVVHTMNVAAGPFKLENLPVYGNQGDLEVVIREEGGTERVMFVPYSSVPEMLPSGSFRYDLNLGQYYHRHMRSTQEKLPVVMLTGKYGFNDDLTLYGGAIFAKEYESAALGAGFSLGSFGAVSGDATFSHASADALNLSKGADGSAWRLRYEKTMLSTGTTINLVNYRYLTGDYRTFAQVAELDKHSGVVGYGNYSERDRFQASISQSFNEWGALNARYTQTNYRNDTDLSSWGLNYSASLWGVSASIDYSRDYRRSYSRGMDRDERIMFSLNIPFSVLMNEATSASVRNTSVDYNFSETRSKNGQRNHSQQVSLRGYSEDSRYTWSVSQTLGHENERDSNIMLGYSGDAFSSDVSYGHNSYSNAYRAGLSGAFVVHSGGITATRYASDSIVVVSIPGVENVRLTHGVHSTTDRFGNAVLPYLTNYSKNTVSLDAATLPNGAILMQQGEQSVYPTQDSIVRIVFPARLGVDALFYLNRNGVPLPFGTKVSMQTEEGLVDPVATGIVGDEGRVYLSGLNRKGILVAEVKSEGKRKELTVPYTVPTAEEGEVAHVWLDLNEPNAQTSPNAKAK